MRKYVRSAIEVELERGGQVYFVHNRVETIYEIASRIQELVPERARRCGPRPDGRKQSSKRVMLAFMQHEFDVLVATTIIENGLDIPLCQHHHHQPRRSPWPERALPAARPRGPLESPRLCLPADSG